METPSRQATPNNAKLPAQAQTNHNLEKHNEDASEVGTHSQQTKRRRGRPSSQAQMERNMEKQNELKSKEQQYDAKFALAREYCLSMPVSTACEKAGIPRSTFRDRVKIMEKDPTTVITKNQIFSFEEEGATNFI